MKYMKYGGYSHENPRKSDGKESVLDILEDLGANLAQFYQLLSTAAFCDFNPSIGSGEGNTTFQAQIDGLIHGIAGKLWRKNVKNMGFL